MRLFRVDDIVKTKESKRLGIVSKVGRKYVHVDWGEQEKLMLPSQLILIAVKLS